FPRSLPSFSSYVVNGRFTERRAASTFRAPSPSALIGELASTLGAVAFQKLDEGLVLGRFGDVQRRLAAAVLRVDGNASLQEQLGELLTAHPGTYHQRGVLIFVRHPHGRAFFDHLDRERFV